MNIDVEDLDERDLIVLNRVAEYPRPMTTTLRESIHWADKNQHVHYRLDKLEERGYVETWKDEDTKTRGPLSPRRAELTDEGENLVDDLGDEDIPDDIEDRMELLEKQVGRMRDTYGQVKQRIMELEEDVEGHDGDLDDLSDEIDDLRQFVEDGGLMFGDGD